MLQRNLLCAFQSLAFFFLPVPRSPGHPCISHWGEKARGEWAGGGGEGFMQLEEVLGLCLLLKRVLMLLSSQEPERGGGNRLR